MIPLPETFLMLSDLQSGTTEVCRLDAVEAYAAAVRTDEREKLRAELMARHAAAKGQHNLYHCLAVELFGGEKPKQ